MAQTFTKQRDAEKHMARLSKQRPDQHFSVRVSWGDSIRRTLYYVIRYEERPGYVREMVMD